VYDDRGFNIIIKCKAYTFLADNDPRLLLNTVVAGVNYTDDSVTITMTDGSCIEADYAICTFSLGVLQNDAVDFSPAFPYWKTEGIFSLQMGTYTKLFLQFPPARQFWDADTQFFLYADPVEHGWYPVWQSLSGPGFLEGSGIFFVTVVDAQSYRAEAQSDDQTLAEVVTVLRKMYPDIDMPDPIAFLYPRWSLEPWAYGSYRYVWFLATRKLMDAPATG
jgi:polyamine oxidase